MQETTEELVIEGLGYPRGWGEVSENHRVLGPYVGTCEKCPACGKEIKKNGYGATKCGCRCVYPPQDES
jgi:hypothetical protein